MSTDSNNEDDDVKVSETNLIRTTPNNQNNGKPQSALTPFLKNEETNTESTKQNKNKKHKKKEKRPPTEAALRRRKRKNLKQKLKEISVIKQKYARDPSSLLSQQIDKMKEEDTIRSRLQSMSLSSSLSPSEPFRALPAATKTDKARAHSRRIYRELSFIATQMTSYSQELRQCIFEQSNIRSPQTFTGNLKNSLLTLQSSLINMVWTH